MHYGDSLAVECTSVVHSFLRCIVGLNECTREHPLWFRTPLKMAVPSNSALFEGIGGDFGYSPSFCLTLIVSLCSGVSSHYPHLHFPFKFGLVYVSCVCEPCLPGMDYPYVDY